MAITAGKAAEVLADEHDIDAELIDPRTLRPLDLDTILASIRDKLFTLPPELTVVCGHGPDTTIGEERRENLLMSFGERVDRLLDGGPQVPHLAEAGGVLTDVAGLGALEDAGRQYVRVHFEPDLERSRRIDVLLDDLVQAKLVGPELLVAHGIKPEYLLTVGDEGS